MKWIIGKNRTVKEMLNLRNFTAVKTITLRKISKNELWDSIPKF